MTSKSAVYQPTLFWFSFFSLIWVLCLLSAGGITTSLHAGMAFLDWPLSNESLNPDGWLTHEDQLAEHSHRLLGMKVGFLGLILYGLLLWKEQRRWVKHLGLALVLLILLQGCLGGARVLWDPLNGVQLPWISRLFAIIHACTAQFLLCLWVSLMIAQSRFFIEKPNSPSPRSTLKIGQIVCCIIFVQLILGAWMRHIDAGLAIPSFPQTPAGTWLPLDWNLPVAIHFAHRVWAIITAGSIITFVWMSLRSRIFAVLQTSWAIALLALLGLQICLGAWTIWTLKNPYAATLHMFVGAVILSITWGLTFSQQSPEQKACF